MVIHRYNSLKKVNHVINKSNVTNNYLQEWCLYVYWTVLVQSFLIAVYCFPGKFSSLSHWELLRTCHLLPHIPTCKINSYRRYITWHLLWKQDISEHDKVVESKGKHQNMTFMKNDIDCNFWKSRHGFLGFQHTKIVVCQFLCNVVSFIKWKSVYSHPSSWHLNQYIGSFLTSEPVHWQLLDIWTSTLAEINGHGGGNWQFPANTVFANLWFKPRTTSWTSTNCFLTNWTRFSDQKSSGPKKCKIIKATKVMLCYI